MGLPIWARFAVPLGLAAPLAVRRLWPVTVFVVVLVIAIGATAFELVGAAYIAPAFALYIVALDERRGRWVPTWLSRSWRLSWHCC